MKSFSIVLVFFLYTNLMYTSNVAQVSNMDCLASDQDHLPQISVKDFIQKHKRNLSIALVLSLVVSSSIAAGFYFGSKKEFDSFKYSLVVAAAKHKWQKLIDKGEVPKKALLQWLKKLKGPYKTSDDFKKFMMTKSEKIRAFLHKNSDDGKYYLPFH